MSARSSIPANAFIGKTKPPTAAELAAALGPAHAVWDRLLGDLAEEFDVKTHEWKSHSPKWGWSLRIMRKARTIVWMGPARGAFNVTFILGDKATHAAQTAKLPKRLLALINEATKYPEGRVVRLVIRTERNLTAIMQLAAIKIAH